MNFGGGGGGLFPGMPGSGFGGGVGGATTTTPNPTDGLTPEQIQVMQMTKFVRLPLPPSFPIPLPPQLHLTPPLFPPPNRWNVPLNPVPSALLSPAAPASPLVASSACSWHPCPTTHPYTLPPSLGNPKPPSPRSPCGSSSGWD